MMRADVYVDYLFDVLKTNKSIIEMDKTRYMVSGQELVEEIELKLRSIESILIKLKNITTKYFHYDNMPKNIKSKYDSLNLTYNYSILEFKKLIDSSNSD